MRATRTNEPISSWQAGDTIAGFALLTKKEARQDRNGKSFLDLIKSKKSGQIDPARDHVLLGKERHEVVGQFSATVGAVCVDQLLDLAGTGGGVEARQGPLEAAQLDRPEPLQPGPQVPPRAEAARAAPVADVQNEVVPHRRRRSRRSARRSARRPCRPRTAARP